LGGLEGLTNGWPLWRDDHPLYYHCALVTRSYLKTSWTTAGYDPSFMAGYAKSVVFPSSSTLPDLVIAAFGGAHPDIAYKLYVLVSAAAVPWLIALACVLWRVPPAGAALAVVLDLLYLWSDFPIQYVTFGMIPYFLAVPTGLVATGIFARFLADGGPTKWLLATVFMSLAFLFHFTTAMVIAPAAALAYVFAAVHRQADVDGVGMRRRGGSSHTGSFEPERRLTVLSHLAVWMIPIIVLAVNSFWWLPGFWLASTKGPSNFAFIHPEGVALRLMKIFVLEAPIQTILLAAGLPGLILCLRRSPTPGWALVAFCAAGFFWGYLAGGLRELDFLQPGRHTYACFTALVIACGAGFDELCARLRAGRHGADRLDVWVIASLLVITFRLVGYPQVGTAGLIKSLQLRLVAGEPFLSSRPSPRLLWVIESIKSHLRPGERLLYEEGGFGVDGESDPFQRGRFSGLLPEHTGVEVIGGPYLHASLQTNFTQFGEGKLFGRADWDRAFFIRYAKLYRMSAIMCWSAHARRFCLENPDLVNVLDDDGTVLIGRIVGFEGPFIEGGGRVEARRGRIRIRDLSAGLDGSVLLRYHFVPYLSTNPSVACEPEYRENDPVPFIRLRPPAGTSGIDLDMHFPVGR
jgi:hypothetical protein